MKCVTFSSGTLPFPSEVLWPSARSGGIWPTLNYSKDSFSVVLAPRHSNIIGNKEFLLITVSGQAAHLTLFFFSSRVCQLGVQHKQRYSFLSQKETHKHSITFLINQDPVDGEFEHFVLKKWRFLKTQKETFTSL